MEHHRPHQRDGDGCRHHRQHEDRAQHAAEGKFPVEDQRRRGAQHQRRDDREHGEVERVDDRLVEPLVADQLDVVVEPDEVRDAADLPVEHAHPDRERPRKDDHGADDDERRDDEQPIPLLPPGEEAGARCRRRLGCHARLRGSHCAAAAASPHAGRCARGAARYAFSLLVSTGWNSAVAFLSSAAGSAPLIMLVSAMPNTSRNSVTGSMMGSPGLRNPERTCDRLEPCGGDRDVGERLLVGECRQPDRRAGAGLQQPRLVLLVGRPRDVEPRGAFLARESRNADAVAEGVGHLQLRAGRHHAVADLADDLGLRGILERRREADAVDPHAPPCPA